MTPAVPGFSILQRVGIGDHQAIKECIHRYGRFIWLLARRSTRTNEDAEDATQDIFVEIWTHAARFDPSLGTESGFIAVIARRRLIDRTRNVYISCRHIDKNVDVYGVQVVSDHPSPCSDSLDAERAKSAMSALRPERRGILEMAYMKAMSHREIAIELSIPLGSVKSHIRRGLLELTDLLAANKPSISRTRRH